MEQLDLFGRTSEGPWSVSHLTEYVRRLLEGDDLLADVWVEGEVSQARLMPSGHLYFSLKDDKALIQCVMWKARAAYLREVPRDGQSILVHGSIGVYEARGAYQLYVDRIREAGVGLMYLEFEKLKRRLEAEGLFAESHKRPLPRFPTAIGVVTSPTGAAIRDILSILARRYPLARVLLAPAQVQGEAAPRQIVDAIELLNEHAQAEVIIVARGGGSPEELWAFNDESVARAIYESRIPVVTGVGHETDFTIADFVADRRAPTPSAAAELVAPDSDDLHAHLRILQERIARIVLSAVQAWRGKLDQETRLLRRLSPMSVIARQRLMVDDLQARAERALQHMVEMRRSQFSSFAAHLESLSPYATLERGYAIVIRARDGRAVTRVGLAGEGELLLTRVRDGTFTSRVEGAPREAGQDVGGKG